MVFRRKKEEIDMICQSSSIFSAPPPPSNRKCEGGGSRYPKYRFRSNDPLPAGREDRDDGNIILHNRSCAHIRNPLSAQ